MGSETAARRAGLPFVWWTLPSLHLRILEHQLRVSRSCLATLLRSARCAGVLGLETLGRILRHVAEFRDQYARASSGFAAVRAGRARLGLLSSTANPTGNFVMHSRERCGAHARTTGKPCHAPARENGRCKLHGGLSTGPKTAAGRERIAAAQRERCARIR